MPQDNQSPMTPGWVSIYMPSMTIQQSSKQQFYCEMHTHASATRGASTYCAGGRTYDHGADE